jgi:hypothetical protein
MFHFRRLIKRKHRTCITCILKSDKTSVDSLTKPIRIRVRRREANFTVITMILFPIQPFVGPHSVWYVSYQSLSRSRHTDHDYDLCHFSAQGECDRSKGDAYTSMAPDPTSGIFRGLCTPICWFQFPIGLWDWLLFITCSFVISCTGLGYVTKIVPDNYRI